MKDLLNQRRSSARHSLVTVTGVLTAAAVVITGCSSSKSSGSTSGSGGSTGSGAASSLPAEVDVTSVQDLTGAVGPVGIATQNGMNLAVKQIEASGMLGSTKIKITYKDTGTTAAQAVSLTSAAVSAGPMAIFGPVSSQEAVAVAPITQQAKIPTIYTQAGSDGIVSAGDYQFRVTAPQQYYQPKMVDYLKAQGITSVSFIYNTSVPTTKAIVETALPPLLKSAGIDIKGNNGFATGTSDFSAYVSKVISQNPDAVGVETTTVEPSPIINALRGAGYKGTIFGGTSFGSASLKAAGQTAKGVLWATDFDPTSTFPQTVSFVNAYKAEYNVNPVNYAAEGYDAVYLLAYGLQDVKGKLTPQSLQAGMLAASQKGFAGALGQLTFDNRDLREAGYIQTWDGSAVQPVKTS